jgi:hypothetical protein
LYQGEVFGTLNLSVIEMVFNGFKNVCCTLKTSIFPFYEQNKTKNQTTSTKLASKKQWWDTLLKFKQSMLAKNNQYSEVTLPKSIKKSRKHKNVCSQLERSEHT